ncbi:MAG TPA: amino acid adenylation domain-containing protein, partial [Thermoanaerobaculia bacterium]|nr:amino acid adenylation domain-containing protein [Thermoanaerobaculia bacterium]
FAAQARRTPDAVAVRCEGEALTYRQLERRAAGLARRLREAGVGPETTVGLLAEPSVPAIVGLLGVLAAGGAYVPLDPGAPAERLAATVADAGISVMLSRGEALSAWHGSTTAIDLAAADDAPPGEAAVAVGRPPQGLAAAAENLAYVLYTSGSTGQPKGVGVPHGAVANYVLAIAERLGLALGAGFAMVQPLTVDSCVTAIFPPLVTGGCLHVIPRERALDAAALAAEFARHPIDCLKIAPSHLAALLSGSGGGLLPRRWLIVGGEASQLAWLSSLRAAAPGCTVFNHYGPTEATVGMLMYRVSGPEGASFSAAAPVGRPIANALAYLLDERLLPVPPGSRGTLYIGGDCLARGYLGRPEATAERFVPDPYARRPGARMYDSGDVMRGTPRGELVFLGRLDHQVKIRGFRVELGEIEAAVARHPAVREAAVRTWEEAPGRAGLVAYVVAAAGAAAPAVAELRQFLAARLPQHMSPSAVVVLAALPRTPHGKLDGKALPPPAPIAPLPAWVPTAGAAASGGPSSPVAELLASLWADLLGRAPAGAGDNFFELGGHSLLATRLLSRLRGAFAVELPLRAIFEHPTLGGLAERITAARTGGSGAGDARPAPPPLDGSHRASRRQAPLPLSFAQQRLFFLDQLEPGSAIYNVPAAFSLAGPLDVAALRRSLGEIVRRHEVLRTRFELFEGEPAQIVLPWPESPGGGSPFRLPVADLSALPPRRRDEQATALAEREAAVPFELSGRRSANEPLGGPAAGSE